MLGAKDSGCRVSEFRVWGFRIQGLGLMFLVMG